MSSSSFPRVVALSLLLLIYINSQWERSLLPYLANGEDASTNISIAVGLSGTQYAFLTGWAFSLLYVSAGLFMGRAADKVSRRLLLFVSCLLWNVCTALCALATTFWHLLVLRLGLGLFQAACAPASYSLISDMFPKDVRSTANGVYAFGVYLGGGLASLSVALSASFGWRVTFLCVGVFGIAAGILFMVIVREPSRGSTDDSKLAASAPSFWHTSKFLVSRRTLRWVTVASAVRFAGGYALGSYLPQYFHRLYPDMYVLYGYINSGIVFFGGVSSAYLGGYLGDKLTSKYPQANALICGFGAALSIPFVCMTLLIDNFALNLVSLFFAYLTAECWLGPAMSILQEFSPANMHGAATGIFLLVGTAVGVTTPLLIGVADDYFSPLIPDSKDMREHPDRVRYILCMVVCCSYVGCCICFWVTARCFVKEQTLSLPGSTVTHTTPLLDPLDPSVDSVKIRLSYDLSPTSSLFNRRHLSNSADESS
eukprot:GILK01016717.1.p1 GENE.GILK01016717.1~~GILK01016717.1.p1  ORF type:complete len:496 (+),score=19.51 GILK01016717.1:41-1489(+)